jgi:hypothetical protein
MKRLGCNSRVALFISFIVVFLPLSAISQTWDTLTDQVVPEDIVERPPEVSYGDDFSRDVFTRENFYDKSAGMVQHRRTIREPKRSMNFEVYNPTDDQEATVVSEPPPDPETGVINKGGKAVTVISIKEDSTTESESE